VAVAAPGTTAAAGGAVPTLSFKGTLDFWGWEVAPENKYMKQLIQEFQAANPGITINYTVQPYADAGTKLLAAVAGQTNPPIAKVHNWWRYELQKSGALAPYAEDFWDWSKIPSAAVNRDPKTNRIYVATQGYYCDELFYNIPMLEAEGIKAPDQLPKTWDDLFKMAKQLTKYDSSGKITRVGCSINHYYTQEWLWASLIYQQGGYLWNENGTEALWNQEPGVRALQLYWDWYHKYNIDDPKTLRSFEHFANENAAMYIGQGYTAQYVINGNPGLMGKWSTAPTPTFTGKPTPAWGQVTPEEGFCVFANASPEKQEAAFAFVKFALGSDSRRMDWAGVLQALPDRSDLFNDPRLKTVDVGNVIQSQAVTMPWRVDYGERPMEAEQIWRTMMDEVIVQSKQPKEALDKATAAINAALKESGVPRYVRERTYKPPTT